MTRRQIDYEDWTGLPQRDTILPRRFNDVADGGGGIPGLQRLIAMNTMNRTWNYLFEGCAMTVNTMGEGWALINGKITHVPSQTISPTGGQFVVVDDEGQASSISSGSITTYASDPEYLVLYYYTGTVYNDIAPRVEDRSGSVLLPLDLMAFIETRHVGGKITFVNHADPTIDLATLDEDGLIVTDGADSISIKYDEIDINGLTFLSEGILQLYTNVILSDDSGSLDVSVNTDKQIEFNIGTGRVIIDKDGSIVRMYPVGASRLGRPEYGETWTQAYIDEIQSKGIKFFETDAGSYPPSELGSIIFDFLGSQLNIGTVNAAHKIRLRAGSNRGITISDTGSRTQVLPTANNSVDIGSGSKKIRDIHADRLIATGGLHTANLGIRIQGSTNNGDIWIENGQHLSFSVAGSFYFTDYPYVDANSVIAQIGRSGGTGFISPWSHQSSDLGTTSKRWGYLYAYNMDLSANASISGSLTVGGVPSASTDVIRLTDLDTRIATLEHGDLNGLADDDHGQYMFKGSLVSDNAIVRWNGTSGRSQQDSLITIDDSGDIDMNQHRVTDLPNPAADNDAARRIYVDNSSESVKQSINQVLPVIHYFSEAAEEYSNWSANVVDGELRLECTVASAQILKMALLSPSHVNRVKIQVTGINGNMDFYINASNKGSQVGPGVFSVVDTVTPNTAYTLHLDPTLTNMKTSKIFVIWYRV